jgi:maltose alpha-D-glucosyltransferase/alpha-amylase
MRHWLDMGVDGMRLDAVPYLCEREGTNNENLPETHAVLKRLRAALDESHPGAIFLAEANQWPEDVLPYFGDGDECHMAFHFPLMPRMYMAIAREDRHPITDIMRQTPDIPANCQWAVFLRNHDELTLEMVTDRERDYLWSTYAAERRARINLGIRRRLAPLMENDRRRIELLNSLLLSMPGTPIIYYGDELGMGDNFFLGDRNGVRTPMQWSEDRNGGFSRADPARLFLPPIMDPVYGYQAVNVEAQTNSPASLLNWMKRIIAVRRGRKAFGRGGLRFLYPSNRTILVYLREYEAEVVLCVCNLSRSAQGVELDLSQFRSLVPVELTGQSAFPPIGELPYFLTLPGYGFYWFLLSREVEPPSWHLELGNVVTELRTVVVQGFDDLITGGARRVLEREVLPPYLQLQRWYADKDVGLEAAELLRWSRLVTSRGDWLLALVGVRRADGGLSTYMMPMAMCWGEVGDQTALSASSHTMARLRKTAQVGSLQDGFRDDALLLALLEAMREKLSLAGPEGGISFHATRALDDVTLPEAPQVTRNAGEQSNSSAIIGDAVVLKLIRRPQEGHNAEVEMGRFLTEVSPFANAPRLLGWAQTEDPAGRAAVCLVLHGFVRNQGDAWNWAASNLGRYLDETGLAEGEGGELLDEACALMSTLGARTAEMHKALARPSGDPDFDPVAVDGGTLSLWRERALDQAEQAVRCCAGSDLAEAAWLAAHKDRLIEAIRRLVPAEPWGSLLRIHGDLHLGQVLVVQGDVHLIDFEGEPARPLEARRRKDSPLRDVAGVLRSLDYAAGSALLRLTQARPLVPGRLEAAAAQWRDAAAKAFLAGYFDTALQGPPLAVAHPEGRHLLELFLIEKACYEICYEARNRPTWLAVPVRGVVALLSSVEA